MENFWSQIAKLAAKFGHKKAAVIVGGGKTNINKFTDLKKALIININDSMLRVSGDIVIVKSKRALKNIIKNDVSINKRYFIIPNDIIEENEKSFFDNLIIIEDLEPFLSHEFNLFGNLAIFGSLIAKELNIFDISLSGFTFDFKDYSDDNKKYNKIYFQNQKDALERFKLKNPLLQITNFKVKLEHKAKLTLDNVIDERISNNETIIVAEFTNNHLGDMKTLLKMVELCKEQGADFIKIQKRDVEHFYTAEEKMQCYESKFGGTLIDYRQGVELSINDIKALDKKCKEVNIPWFSTVLDFKSFVDLSRVKLQKLIKLPSTISTRKNYLKNIAGVYDKKCNIVISTGATDQNYIEWILDYFYNDDRYLFLLHTLSAYPTPLEDINIGIINLYKKMQVEYPKLIPGYSGHDIGNLGTQMAVAAGAMMVEKHVKLENNNWIHFDGVASSLNNGEFCEYVKAVRLAEAARGKEEKIVHSIEHHKYSSDADISGYGKI